MNFTLKNPLCSRNSFCCASLEAIKCCKGCFQDKNLYAPYAPYAPSQKLYHFISVFTIHRGIWILPSKTHCAHVIHFAVPPSRQLKAAKAVFRQKIYMPHMPRMPHMLHMPRMPQVGNCTILLGSLHRGIWILPQNPRAYEFYPQNPLCTRNSFYCASLEAIKGCKGRFQAKNLYAPYAPSLSSLFKLRRLRRIF